MLEAVLKAAAMVEIHFVFVPGVHIAAAHLPEEGVELILVAVFFEIVEKAYFFAVGLEVRPYVPVDRHDHFALQVFRHAKNVD